MENRSLLVVDDDDVYRTRLVRAFTDRGFDARGESGVRAAIASATSDSPELAVIDLRMPDGSGLDLVRGLRAIDATTKMIVLTGFGSIATALEAIRLGAVHYVTKPANVDEILASFEKNDSGAATRTNESVPTLARVEWEHIQRVLVRCEGNVSAAARLLGIHRRSLQRKLEKHPTTR